MLIWGKLIGAGLGFMLGGVLGALIGAVLGHFFDRGMANAAIRDGEPTPDVFFATTFAVMGAVAKADGRVSPEEIQLAEAAMRHMSLNQEQRKTAISHFNRGKEPGFDLDAALNKLWQHVWRRPLLKRMFIELQLQAAYADGHLHSGEYAVLLRVADVLKIRRADLDRLAQATAARMGGDANGDDSDIHATGGSLDYDYALLNVSRDASDSELKRAYRRLISQHHPDKLVAKGLPEAMIKAANEKTAAIKQAYERIVKARERGGQ